MGNQETSPEDKSLPADLLRAPLLGLMDRWAVSFPGRFLRGIQKSLGMEPSKGDKSPNQEPPSLKPIRRFAPPSWKDFLRGQPQVERLLFTSSPEDLQNFPPTSLFPDRPVWATNDNQEHFGKDDTDGSGMGGEDDEKPLPATATSSAKPLLTPSGLSTPPPGYQEKLEAYESKYGYMKSWPGLLRLMGALELILGGLVFACTAAYIQKDYQWSQLYGDGLLPYSSLTGGYNYYGPMTPFVLVVAGLAWLLTVILLGLGVTMYYRAILLHSGWWPLAEFALNLLLFLLYMAASIAYLNDLNRGGLCYSAFALNPLAVALCHVDGGQVAAIVFLFLNTLAYLAGALVCLQMWKHEAQQRLEAGMQPPPVPLRDLPEVLTASSGPHPAGKTVRHVEFSEKDEALKNEGLKVQNASIPTGYNPKPHVVPDYVVKYPAIGNVEERERYKAVFGDQYGEYKALHRQVQVALRKFKEFEARMDKLPQQPWGQKEESRVSAVWKEFENKKKDPNFLEKQERCEYLKRKLAHLKGQIEAFDRQNGKGGAGSSIYF